MDWGRIRANGKGEPLLQAAEVSGTSAPAAKPPANDARVLRGATRTGAAAVSVSLKGTDTAFLPLTHSSNEWHRRPSNKKLPATPKS